MPPDLVVMRQNLSCTKLFFLATAAHAHSVRAPRSQGLPPRRSAAFVLARASVVSRTNSRPRTDLSLRRKLRHVRPRLREDLRRGAPLYPRHRLQKLPLFHQPRRLNLLDNLTVQLLQLFFQKPHVGQTGQTERFLLVSSLPLATLSTSTGRRRQTHPKVHSPTSR